MVRCRIFASSYILAETDQRISRTVSLRQWSFLLFINFPQVSRIALLVRPPDVSREDIKFYTWIFFLFYQSTMLSSHAVDDYQMHFVGLIVDKASTIVREISHNPPLIFTRVGGSKSAKFGECFPLLAHCGFQALHVWVRYCCTPPSTSLSVTVTKPIVIKTLRNTVG